MRQCGVLALLVLLIHASEGSNAIRKAAAKYSRDIYEKGRGPRQARPDADLVKQRDRLAKRLKSAWKELESAKKTADVQDHDELYKMFMFEDTPLNEYMAPGFTPKELQVWNFADCPSKTQQTAVQLRAATTADGQNTYELKYLEYVSRMKYCEGSKKCEKAARRCYTSTTRDFCKSAGVFWTSRCESKVNQGIPPVYDDSTYSILANHHLRLLKPRKSPAFEDYRALKRYTDARRAVVKLLREVPGLLDDFKFAGVAWDTNMPRAAKFAQTLGAAQEECACHGFGAFRSVLHNDELIENPVFVPNGGYTSVAGDALNWGIGHAPHKAMHHIMRKYRKYAKPLCIEKKNLVQSLSLTPQATGSSGLSWLPNLFVR